MNFIFRSCKTRNNQYFYVIFLSIFISNFSHAQYDGPFFGLIELVSGDDRGTSRGVDPQSIPLNFYENKIIWKDHGNTNKTLKLNWGLNKNIELKIKTIVSYSHDINATYDSKIKEFTSLMNPNPQQLLLEVEIQGGTSLDNLPPNLKKHVKSTPQTILIAIDANKIVNLPELKPLEETESDRYANLKKIAEQIESVKLSYNLFEPITVFESVSSSYLITNYVTQADLGLRKPYNRDAPTLPMIKVSSGNNNVHDNWGTVSLTLREDTDQQEQELSVEDNTVKHKTN